MKALLKADESHGPVLQMDKGRHWAVTGLSQAYAKALLREVRFHSYWINTERKENALKYWGIILAKYKIKLLHLVHKKGSK